MYATKLVPINDDEGFRYIKKKIPINELPKPLKNVQRKPINLVHDRKTQYPDPNKAKPLIMSKPYERMYIPSDKVVAPSNNEVYNGEGNDETQFDIYTPEYQVNGLKGTNIFDLKKNNLAY